MYLHADVSSIIAVIGVITDIQRELDVFETEPMSDVEIFPKTWRPTRWPQTPYRL